jgi:hypothetical protein
MSKLLEDKAPCAHQLGLLVPLIALLDSGLRDVDALASSLDAAPDDVLAHLQLARWLRWTRGKPPKLTSLGAVFARQPSMRQGMLVESVLRHPIMTQVRRAERVERDLRAACARAIATACKANPPADADVARCAGSLAHLIAIARDPARIDWTSGALDEDPDEVELTFEGRTFLTTLATRSFGAPAQLQIALPAQVIAFCQPEPPPLPGWQAASLLMPEQGPAGERVLWFGSTPADAQTLAVAARRGKGMRALLTTTTPYVTLLVALLCWRPAPDAASPITISADGELLLADNAPMGALTRTLRSLARGLGLEQIEGLPSRPDDPLARPATLAQLIAALRALDLLADNDQGAVALSPAFTEELHAPGAQDAPSLFERLAPLHADMNLLMRRFI